MASDVSKYPEFPLYSAMATAEELYGIKIKLDDFLGYAKYAMKTIGYNCARIKTLSEVSDEGFIDLPSEAVSVQAVADDANSFSSWRVPEIGEGSVVSSRFGDTAVDTSLHDTDGLVHYIDFNFRPPTTVEVDVAFADETVYVLYDTIIKDETGMPLLHYKQVIAVAMFATFLHLQKRQFAGFPSPIDLRELEFKARMEMDNAKVPDVISDNQWSKILDAKVSFNRKLPNRDFFIG